MPVSFLISVGFLARDSTAIARPPANGHELFEVDAGGARREHLPAVSHDDFVVAERRRPPGRLAALLFLVSALACTGNPATPPPEGVAQEQPTCSQACATFDDRSDDPTDAPIADPIPEAPLDAGVVLTLEELVTMPASSGAAPRARINYLGEVPDGSGRLFVPDLNGTLYTLERRRAARLPRRGRRLQDFVSSPGLGTGFGFVTFHPEFAANGRFYTVHTESGAALVTQAPDLPAPEEAAYHGVVTEWTAGRSRRGDVLRDAPGGPAHRFRDLPARHPTGRLQPDRAARRRRLRPALCGRW